MTFVFMLICCLCLTAPANADPDPAPTAQQTAAATTEAQTVSENAAPEQTPPAVEAQKTEPSEMQSLLEKMKNRKRPSLSFKMTSTQGTEKKTFNIYSKNDKWRLETSVYEGSLNNVTRVVVLSDGTGTFIYAPSVHVATKGEFPEINVLNELMNLDLSSYKTTGSSTVNGYKCRLLTSDKDGSEICFSEEFLLPVIFRTGENSIELSDISEKTISDDSFSLPPDVYVF